MPDGEQWESPCVQGALKSIQNSRAVVTWTGLRGLKWAQLTAPIFITETQISEREKAG